MPLHKKGDPILDVNRKFYEQDVPLHKKGDPINSYDEDVPLHKKGDLIWGKQKIRFTDGSYGEIGPILIPQTIVRASGEKVNIYPEDTETVDNSHTSMFYKANFYSGDWPSLHQDRPSVPGQLGDVGQGNDAYALVLEHLRYRTPQEVFADQNLDPRDPNADDFNIVDTRTGSPPTTNPTLYQKQMAELVMGHLDCDTVPFLWRYADRFTLFDNFHQTTIGPSTPNAIAMIAGQSGETQWARHPLQGAAGVVPIIDDRGPFAGSSADQAKIKPPYNPADSDTNTPNGDLTFASLPLSFMGDQIQQILAQGTSSNRAPDSRDVQNDIGVIAKKNDMVEWRWYQQGYGDEKFDGSTVKGTEWKTGEHRSYIVHHNGPQYFGYLGDNTDEQKKMHSLNQFFATLRDKGALWREDGALPKDRGVIYIRGGLSNWDSAANGVVVPKVCEKLADDEKCSYLGNDDHPTYSDAMISEAFVAETVNAIVHSDYWDKSMIIITYDETDGMYDHAPWRVRSWDASSDHLPLAGGPRIPAIVISPFSAAHTISHQYSEHSSVIKFINKLFNLVPLADLPDELEGRRLGASKLGQANLGPADDLVSDMGDLMEAFDIDRLDGTACALAKPDDKVKVCPLQPKYAVIEPSEISSYPHHNRQGCSWLKIKPTDYPNELGRAPSDPAPWDFNPRPSKAPGIPQIGGGTDERH